MNEMGGGVFDSTIFSYVGILHVLCSLIVGTWAHPKSTPRTKEKENGKKKPGEKKKKTD